MDVILQLSIQCLWYMSLWKRGECLSVTATCPGLYHLLTSTAIPPPLLLLLMSASSYCRKAGEKYIWAPAAISQWNTGNSIQQMLKSVKNTTIKTTIKSYRECKGLHLPVVNQPIVLTAVTIKSLGVTALAVVHINAQTPTFAFPSLYPCPTDDAVFWLHSCIRYCLMKLKLWEAETVIRWNCDRLNTAIEETQLQQSIPSAIRVLGGPAGCKWCSPSKSLLIWVAKQTKIHKWNIGKVALSCYMFAHQNFVLWNFTYENTCEHLIIYFFLPQICGSSIQDWWLARVMRGVSEGLRSMRLNKTSWLWTVRWLMYSE